MKKAINVVILVVAALTAIYVGHAKVQEKVEFENQVRVYHQHIEEEAARQVHLYKVSMGIYE